MKTAKRLEMSWPINKGKERYEQAEKLMLIAKKMQKVGVRVDIRAAQQHQVDAEKRIQLYTGLFIEATGLTRQELGGAGAGQTDAVKQWFWTKQEAPKLVFSKETKEAQFNSALLTAYASDYQDTKFGPAAAALLGLRKARTARKYAESYEAVAAKFDGRIHFAFNIFGTKGERWSSSAKFFWRDNVGNPVEHAVNAQQVPSKLLKFDFKDGKGDQPLALSQRNCFIPNEGCVWVKQDYEALELQLIMCNSGSRLLKEWLSKGLDPHIENAKILFKEAKIPSEWVNKDDPKFKKFKVFRDAAKPIVYGATYQYSDPHRENKYPELFKQFKQSFPQMAETYLNVLVQRLYEAHPEIQLMQQRVAKDIQVAGKVDLPVGHGFLYLPATNRGYNQGINALHQSGGGALISRALVNIDKEFPWGEDDAAILLQVHDELDAQIPEKKLDDVTSMMENYLSAPAEFNGVSVSIPADSDIGPNWRDVKGDWRK